MERTRSGRRRVGDDSGDDDVEEDASGLGGRAGVGERRRREFETCCELYAARGQDFLAEGTHRVP